MRVQLLIASSFAVLAIAIGIYLRPDAFSGATATSIVLFILAIAGWNEAIKRAREYDKDVAVRDKRIIEALEAIYKKLDKD